MFIGRREELCFLENQYREANGRFVVLYGRRRVGKTETIRKFCEGKKHIFYTCIECPDEQQLQAFSKRILQTGIPASRYLQTFADWEQAFLNVLEVSSTEKVVLVIDEFPYMVKGNSSIPSILQKLWDETLRNENIMLILCGSSMSFMEREILGEKNPLYGRTTGILKMQEMSFYEAIQFVPGFSPEDKITTYAILGGIPHYLRQFDDKLSLEENIKEKILNRGSVLYSEVEFLLRQELRETSVYNVIIQAIALGNTKLHDIHQKTQIEKTKLTAYLRNLMDLRLITREFSIEDGIKESANVQRGLYRLTDHYFRFWYALVLPNLSELEAGDVNGVYQYAVAPELERYTSYAFEDVCKSYLRQQNQEDRLPFHFSKIGRWWNKNEELDILAVDYKKEQYLLGECKYKRSEFSFSDLTRMKEKFGGYTRKQIYYYLFSRGGFAEKVVEAAKTEPVTLVCLDDIISVKI